MRRLAPNGKSFQVELSAAAWLQVGSLTVAVFRRIQQELSGIAELASADEQLGLSHGSPLDTDLCVVVDGHVAVYRVDSDRRLITVLSISERLPDAL